MERTKHISIRLSEETLRKFHYVAKFYDRSSSKQIANIIHKCIREFELEHGKIELEDLDKLITSR